MTEMETENQTAKRQYLQTTRTRGKPTIVGPNMTEKRKNNKVYYNWPISQTNHGSVKMFFLEK